MKQPTIREKNRPMQAAVSEYYGRLVIVLSKTIFAENFSNLFGLRLLSEYIKTEFREVGHQSDFQSFGQDRFNHQIVREMSHVISELLIRLDEICIFHSHFSGIAALLSKGTNNPYMTYAFTAFRVESRR